MAEQYISVGKIGKPHGLSGAFRFLLTSELKNKKKTPGHFMIQNKGSFLPWFVSKVEWLGFNEGFIWFEEITSVDKAKEHTKKELFLSERDFDKFFKKDADDLGFLVGFKVIEQQHGTIGTIAEITENPGQVLCIVKKNENESVIPFVEEFIVSINKRKKEIVFSLPEGLLNL